MAYQRVEKSNTIGNRESLWGYQTRVISRLIWLCHSKLRATLQVIMSGHENLARQNAFAICPECRLEEEPSF